MPVGWKYINGNPWQQHIPDCTLRSLAIGLNHSYIDLCKLFRVPCELGYGFTGEYVASTPKILKIGERNKLIKAFDLDWMFNQTVLKDKEDSFSDPEAGLTINEQALLLPEGKYIFIIRPRTRSLSGDWHATYVNTKTGVLFDSFNCLKDKSVVYGYIQINPEAVLDSSNPKSRMKEIEKLNAGELWGSRVPRYVSPEKWKIWKEDPSKIPSNLVGRIAYMDKKKLGLV